MLVLARLARDFSKAADAKGRLQAAPNQLAKVLQGALGDAGFQVSKK
jgi:hypothetical protein